MSAPYSRRFMQNLKMALLCYLWGGEGVCECVWGPVCTFVLCRGECVSEWCLQESAVSWTSVSINIFLLWEHEHRFTNTHHVLTHHFSPWGLFAFVTSLLTAPGWSLMMLLFQLLSGKAAVLHCFTCLFLFILNVMMKTNYRFDRIFIATNF